MKSLPMSADALRGLRAARWVRESSGRQLDKYGPGAQRRMQDKAIAEYDLIDAGLAWTVAKSGWSGPDSMLEPPAVRTPEFRAMLAAAEGGQFEVLLVGYTSRFLRDITLALHYRRFFHANGVAVWICDDRILTSDPNDWERLVEKLKAAEVSSRDQSKNVKSGYADKREAHRDPGGHAPFGFRRNDGKLVEPDPEQAHQVRRIVELAASGWTDRAMAAEVGLGLYVVRGVLTSPLTVGRLRDGGPANWGPLVPIDLWNQAQAVRARRATNSGRPAAPHRPYALSMLHCAACGARLIGDTGYYRHKGVCREFAAATPEWPTGWRGRRDGKGYQRTMFEDVIRQILRQVSLEAGTLTKVVGRVSSPKPTADQFKLTRIERERDAALSRFRRDRDTTALVATMDRLDADERLARQPRDPGGIPADVAVRYLRELADTWEAADGGPGRRMLAEALFERIEAQGFRETTLRLTDTAIAHGFAEVLSDRLEVTVGYGRGERI
jgi:hypothetical protein